MKRPDPHASTGIGGATGPGAPGSASAPDLLDREVLLCISGGIAAYKVCDVASKLTQRGAGVTVAMTRAAQEFVTPLTFQALTGRSVLTDVFAPVENRCHTRVRPAFNRCEEPGHTQNQPRTDSEDIQHISLTDRAELLIVAPATANILGKIAAGIADDIVTTLVISTNAPVLLAPAMNARMWANAAVQANLNTLLGRGFKTVGPADGWLACRTVGPGRMAEAAEIIAKAAELLAAPKP